LKDAVFQATGLRCSIAVAPNKLLAKIGSELDKPDGLTLLTEADITTRIWPLAARKVNGIGPKAAEKLAGFGMHTIGDVAAADPQFLITEFGRSFGAWLHSAAHGRDERAIVTHSEPKSISRETTFERDLHAVHDRSALSALFTRLCERLASDLQRKGYVAQTLGIKLRFDDFKRVSRDVTLPAPIADAQAIRQAAGSCLKRVDLSRRLRLIGVRAAGLVQASAAASAGAVVPRPRGAAQPPASIPHKWQGDLPFLSASDDGTV
jgi:DNA polymerase-4